MLKLIKFSYKRGKNYIKNINSEVQIEKRS